MFETFVINEILKSYSNEGLEYDFNVFYYNGKDKKKKKENGVEIEADGEIDLILQEDGILYPIEIKMSATPKADMASEFDVLDGVPELFHIAKDRQTIGKGLSKKPNPRTKT